MNILQGIKQCKLQVYGKILVDFRLKKCMKFGVGLI